MPYSTIFLVFRSQYHVAEFVKGPWPIVYSHQVVFSQVQLQDGVLHSSEHEPDVLGVCRAGEMTVDYFLCVGIQVDEHAEDELPGGDGVSLRTVVLGKVVN